MGMHGNRRAHRARMVPAVLCLAALAGGCMHPLEKNWRAYRAAKKRGDYAAAKKYLADDARIWWGEKEGSGAPLTTKGGPYKDWDREFRSESTRQDVQVVGRTVTYLTTEINDYYRLLERPPSPARVTYYFDDDDRICGMLYKGLNPQTTEPVDRYDEFKAWADETYPGLLDSEEMKIPTQPQRWRTLLTEWRAEAGLPPVE